jgi:hypothetical protein
MCLAHTEKSSPNSPKQHNNVPLAAWVCTRVCVVVRRPVSSWYARLIHVVVKRMHVYAAGTWVSIVHNRSELRGATPLSPKKEGPPYPFFEA